MGKPKQSQSQSQCARKGATKKRSSECQFARTLYPLPSEAQPIKLLIELIACSGLKASVAGSTRVYPRSPRLLGVLLLTSFVVPLCSPALGTLGCRSTEMLASAPKKSGSSTSSKAPPSHCRVVLCVSTRFPPLWDHDTSTCDVQHD